MPISNTITEFRQNVLKQGGPQLASFYKMVMNTGADSVTVYPQSIVLPGRSFSFFEHDIWGPVRRVPYKRLYTTCNVTFIIYQDWSEKLFIEKWMNKIVVSNPYRGIGPRDIEKSTPPVYNLPGSNFSELFSTARTSANDAPDANFGEGIFDEWIDYSAAGTVTIDFLNSQDRSKVNHSIDLYEAFPSTISQVSMGSDATGYPSFTVGFQFRSYTVYGGGGNR
jgi:hypothetical protein